MKRMPALGSFWWALGIGWVALGIAGWQYAGLKHVPAWVAVPVAAAFLIEYAFYLAAGMPPVRARLARRSKPAIAAALTAAGMAPYLLYSTFTVQFDALHFGGLLAIAAGISLWYVRLRPAPLTDLAFLAILAATVLSGALRKIYTAPVPHLPLDVLGHLMLIHTAVLAIFLLRESDPPFRDIARANAAPITRETSACGVGRQTRPTKYDGPFGFIPTLGELQTGILYSGMFCVIGLPLAFALKVVHLPDHPPSLWRIVALLLGVFWVVAYSEEFFFRGLLQTWLSQWLRSAPAGLLLASICFGLSHLNYAGHFPNWRVSLCAAIAGVFYGRAFQTSRSVRAGMVAHTIVVTIWKSLAA